jgi:LETM1 and EF-hand domain-containing protein 1
MSLWLPRPSPILLARSYSRSQRVLHTHFISSFVLRNTVGHPRPSVGLSSYRFQSSKASRPTASSEPCPSSLPTDPVTLSDVKPSPPAKEPRKGPLMTRVWKKVKHEAAHYWHGTKLLFSEVRISARLQWKILHGEVLTRRERRQV